MTHTTLWLSQVQFFSSLAFMALFLALELGLAWMLAYFRLRSLSAPAGPWMAAYRFWVRVFAVAFILAFAAGLPVLIQFGSLWPSLMGRIGDVAGPLLAAGLTTVFIFKSCFLGAMLFGERQLSDRAHAAVVVMVAVGATAMAFWPLTLVSWMHTPAGAYLLDEHYRVTAWLSIIFNPSLPWYAGLFAGASMLAAACLVMGVIATQTLRRPAEESERLAFRAAARLACVVVILQVVFAAGAGLVAARYQPAKAAATAGYWQSGTQPDLVFFGWPDAATQENRAALRWRHAGGRWLGRDQLGAQGLDKFSGMAPPVALTFFSFRVAALAGLLTMMAAWLSWLKLRRHAYDPACLPRWWRHALAVLAFSPWVMLLAGAAHILLGAYPYAVNGTITVSEITGDTPAGLLAAGLAAFLGLYVLFVAGFMRMLGYISRYGVVPVARRRGRA